METKEWYKLACRVVRAQCNQKTYQGLQVTGTPDLKHVCKALPRCPAGIALAAVSCWWERRTLDKLDTFHQWLLFQQEGFPF